jgi:hypothetical protein
VWEDGSVDELLQVAFSVDGKPDLALSVYVVTPPQFDRARAEHLISMTGPPVSAGAKELDLTGLGIATQSRGETLFAFTQGAHAEVRLNDEAELRELIQVVLREPSRRLSRDATTVLDYMVHHRLDPEWASALASKPKWAKFVAKRAMAGAP